MAKKRRRRKTKPLSPTGTKKPRKTREHINSMASPNHLALLDLPETMEDMAVESDIARFPLTTIKKSEGYSGNATGLAFVDDEYGCSHWSERAAGAPPTWMDPEIFVRMCLRQTSVHTIAAKCKKSSSKAASKPMVDVVQAVLENDYIPYLLENFDEVKHLIVEWLTAYLAQKDLYPDAQQIWRNNVGLGEPAQGQNIG